jgi:hypothetical protein
MVNLIVVTLLVFPNRIVGTNATAMSTFGGATGVGEILCSNNVKSSTVEVFANTDRGKWRLSTTIASPPAHREIAGSITNITKSNITKPLAGILEFRGVETFDHICNKYADSKNPPLITISLNCTSHKGLFVASNKLNGSWVSETNC